MSQSRTGPGLEERPLPTGERVHRPERPHRLYDPEKTEWIVRHRLPGRVRLYSDAIRHDRRLTHGIRTALCRLPGVKCVQASDATGTVLVVFEPSACSLDEIVNAIRHAHRARNKLAGIEEVEMQALRRVEHLLATCDRGIQRASRGTLNLRRVALTTVAARALLGAAETGFVSLEAADSAFHILMAWILFRHPKLERELEKIEGFVEPGV